MQELGLPLPAERPRARHGARAVRSGFPGRGRGKATEARKRLKLEGIDPIEARENARRSAAIEAARGITFEDCAKKYIAAHEAGWRNEVHRKQWSSTLEPYAYR